MRRIDLKIINDALYRIAEQGNLKHKYGVAKNINILKDEFSIIEKLNHEIDDCVPSFNKQRNELINKISGGKGRIDLSDSEVAGKFLAENSNLIEKSRKEFPDEWKAHDKKQKEFNEFLNEDVKDKYDFYKLSIENMNDDVTENDIAILMAYGIID